MPSSARRSAMPFPTSPGWPRVHRVWSRSLCFVTFHMCPSNVAGTLFSLAANFSSISPFDARRIDCEQHVSIRLESTPFHTRVQQEQSFDDTLHLRCFVRGSYCTDVGLLSFFLFSLGPQAPIISLSPQRGRLVIAVKPAARVSSLADPSVQTCSAKEEVSQSRNS